MRSGLREGRFLLGAQPGCRGVRGQMPHVDTRAPCEWWACPGPRPGSLRGECRPKLSVEQSVTPESVVALLPVAATLQCPALPQEWGQPAFAERKRRSLIPPRNVRSWPWSSEDGSGSWRGNARCPGTHEDAWPCPPRGCALSLGLQRPVSGSGVLRRPPGLSFASLVLGAWPLAPCARIHLSGGGRGEHQFPLTPASVSSCGPGPGCHVTGLLLVTRVPTVGVFLASVCVRVWWA